MTEKMSQGRTNKVLWVDEDNILPHRVNRNGREQGIVVRFEPNNFPLCYRFILVFSGSSSSVVVLVFLDLTAEEEEPEWNMRKVNMNPF